jgi:hypothetical protein
MKPQIKIVDCTTGEEIVRDATAAEIKAIEAKEAKAVIERDQMQSEATQRQAIFDRLGLTADEAKLILG